MRIVCSIVAGLVEVLVFAIGAAAMILAVSAVP
jgi:hypothetical protein